MTQAEKAQNAAENDSWGGAITIIAMTIVLAALIVLSILFLGFGKISSMLMGRKKLEAHGITKEEAGDDHKEVDSGETFAAIALALSQHLDQRHVTLRTPYSPYVVCARLIHLGTPRYTTYALYLQSTTTHRKITNKPSMAMLGQ